MSEPPGSPTSSPSSPPLTSPPGSPGTTPPVTPAATPPVTPPAGVSAGVRDQLAQRGIPADRFESDEEALDALLGAAQAYESHLPYIQMGQQAAADWEAYQQWKQSQNQGDTPGQPGTQAGQPPQPESAWQWQAPEFDPAWYNLFDANGQPLPGVDPTVVAKVRAYAKWKQEQESNFWRDPRSVIRKAVEDDLKRLDPQSEVFAKAVEEKVNAALQNWQARQEAERTLRDNEKRFYQTDDSGRRRTDPRTGQYLLTAQGQAFDQHFRELVQDGLPEQAAWKHAMRALDADVAAGKFGPPQSSQPGQPGQPGQQPGQAAQPGQPGNGQTPPNPREMFFQRALQQQRQYPGSLPETPNDGTIPRSPGEPVAGRPRSTREIAEWLNSQP